MALLGARLQQARQARGVSALQVEIDTRIRATVITALESGDYESLPPEPFLRGLIRTYALYLGLDGEEMLRLYVADFAPPPPPPPPPPVIRRAPAPVMPKEPEPIIAPPANAPGKSLFAHVSPKIESSTPPPPPESLAPVTPIISSDMPPEKVPAMPTAQLIFSRRLPRVMPIQLPTWVIIAIGVGIAIFVLACGVLIFTQVLPAAITLFNPPRTLTPTRAPATRTPTLQAGAAPTGVPTFAATAPPFSTVPLTQTTSAAARATPRRTIEPVTTGLNLDIEAVEKVTVHVGADGVLVFEGTLDPGSTRTWSARESLYVSIENAKGATLIFNGKAQAARTFAERTKMERQWDLNTRGVPIAVPPVFPAVPTSPTKAVVPSNAPPQPTPTLTPTA
jgi:cytoskeleton protein RodZ